MGFIWADKDKGEWSARKKAKIAKRKAKQRARLQKRAERGGAHASAKLERIETREALDEARKEPMVSDAKVMQNLARTTDTTGTVAGQGALSNVLTSPEGPDVSTIQAQVEGLADPVAGSIAQAVDAENKLAMMHRQDLANRLERNKKLATDTALASTQLALQSVGQGSGAVAGATTPKTA